MDSIISFILCIILITAVSFIGAYIPMAFKATDRQIHMMIAFSAGVFIGILFLILLPEALHESAEGGFSEIDVMYVVMAGFLIMFAVDFIIKHYKKQDCECKECSDHHSHDITSISAFIGLSIHACFDGLAIAAAFLIGEEIGLIMLVAMCLHKAVEVFSLSSAFLLSKNNKRSWSYLIVFCLLTPIAALLSYFVLGEAESAVTGMLFAFSAGIFMFVTMLHMIPEAFHRKDADIKSLILLIIGLVIVILVAVMMGPHTH